MTDYDTRSDTHTQHVPPEFIPDGYLGVTDYTEEDLPSLAEAIASDVDAPVDEILDSLESLVHEYNVPVVDADRSMRVEYGEGEA